MVESILHHSTIVLAVQHIDYAVAVLIMAPSALPAATNPKIATPPRYDILRFNLVAI